MRVSQNILHEAIEREISKDSQLSFPQDQSVLFDHFTKIINEAEQNRDAIKASFYHKTLTSNHLTLTIPITNIIAILSLIGSYLGNLIGATDATISKEILQSILLLQITSSIFMKVLQTSIRKLDSLTEESLLSCREVYYDYLRFLERLHEKRNVVPLRKFNLLLGCSKNIGNILKIGYPWGYSEATDIVKNLANNLEDLPNWKLEEDKEQTFKISIFTKGLFLLTDGNKIFNVIIFILFCNFWGITDNNRIDERLTTGFVLLINLLGTILFSLNTLESPFGFLTRISNTLRQIR